MLLNDSAVFKALWQTSPIGLAIVSLEGRFVQVNRALCAFLEYTDVELMTRTWQDLTPDPRDLEADTALVAKVARGERASYELLKRYRTKFDRIVYARLGVSGIQDDEGKVVALCSQIVPVIHEPGAGVKITDKGNGELRVDSSRPPGPVAAFLSQNWKWLLTAILAFGGWTGTQIVEARLTQEKVESLEAEVKKIRAGLESDGKK